VKRAILINNAAVVLGRVSESCVFSEEDLTWVKQTLGKIVDEEAEFLVSAGPRSFFKDDGPLKLSES
jgi:hypothetical protein